VHDSDTADARQEVPRRQPRNLYRQFARSYSMTATPARLLPPIMAAVVALFAASAVAEGSPGKGRTASTAGVSLQLPAGWQAQITKTPACDPERLIVASSTPTHIAPSGRLRSPPAGAVLVVLLEDRYRQDRPLGDLRRPQHFSGNWNHLAQIKPSCGLPASPAYMHYVKTHGRYLGFIVYPGSAVDATTRAATIALMDSLHVDP
jgi:hypothetical protein